MRRLLRTLRIVLRDERLPRWLRWLLGIGLLPWPGPVDELVLLGCAPFLLLRWHVLREAWANAANPLSS